MDNRWLERIIIIILLLLNLFLAGVVLTDRVESRRSEAIIVNDVCSVLRDNGIAMNEDAVLVQPAPKKCTLKRNSEQEQKLVYGLLGGKYSSEDLGGNILFYRSARGQAVFRGSGEMEALFNLNSVSLRGSAEKTAARFLRRIGIPAKVRETGVNASDGEAYAEFYCYWGGYPVYNAVLRVDYSGDSVYMLTGTRVFDDPTEENDDGLLDSVSALLRFLEILRAGEFACSRVDGLRPGYLLSVQVSGESILTPVWQVETDGGILLINAENGRIESRNA